MNNILIDHDFSFVQVERLFFKIALVRKSVSPVISFNRNEIFTAIKFFDNFGLDDDDISKFGNKLNGDGFKAWYFIQHYNGFTKVEGFGKTCYQPFITQAT